ncbi:MAG: beta-lactamase family protein [Myxococcales bacterium]|nr:beta-lactamase family protein [Myxococcales bacterium]
MKRPLVSLSIALLIGCGASDESPPAEVGGGGGDGGGADVGGEGGQGGQPLDPRFVELGKILEQDMETLDIPGAAVALIENGEVVFVQGYGVRERGGTEPVDGDTLFALASVSKSITATAVSSVVEDHADVSLDSAAIDWIPTLTFPPDELVPTITLRMLLNHSAGFPSYWQSSTSQAESTDASAQLLVTNLLPFLASYGFELFSTPGLAFTYSNPGYGLAALAAESIEGAYFADIVKQRVAMPLGMTRTFARASEVEAAGNYTRGVYDDLTVTLVGPRNIDVAWGRPAGLIWSSASDMAKFVRFHLEGDAAVLSDEARLAMQSPQMDVQSCFASKWYGYGLYANEGFWWLRYSADAALAARYHPVRTVAHTGGIDGFRTFVLWLPDERAGYVLLQNASPYRPWKAMDYIHDAILPLGEPGTPPDDTGDPENWAPFAGNYFDPVFLGNVTVTVDEEGVHVDMPDSPYVYADTLTPLCNDTFLLGLAGFTLEATLIHDLNGDPNLIRIEGANFLERIPPTAVAPKTTALLAPLEVRRAELMKALRQHEAEHPMARRAKR